MKSDKDRVPSGLGGDLKVGQNKRAKATKLFII